MLTSAKERVFCAGANIRMLSQSVARLEGELLQVHQRDAQRDRGGDARSRGQRTSRAVNGPCAGGGYELALASERIVMADDGNTSVSLPEVPLLAVLPGTGGLTRLIDKRHVRRDRADFFCTLEEGIKGKRAVEWRLVDEVVPRSRLEETVRSRAAELRRAQRPAGGRARHRAVAARAHDRGRPDRLPPRRPARSTGRAASPRSPWPRPTTPPPADLAGRPRAGRRVLAAGPGARARRPDPASPRPTRRRSALGAPDARAAPTLVEAYDRLLSSIRRDWLVREIRLYLQAGPQAPRRVVALGLRADRARLVLRGHPARAGAGRRPLLHARRRRARATTGRRRRVRLDRAELRRRTPWSTGSRGSQSRFLGEPRRVDDLKRRIGEDLDARGRGGGRAGDVHARRHRLGRRGADRASRSARRSRPTRSPAWRRRSASAGRRRSRARSSRGSPRGRTGSSSDRTRWGAGGAPACTGPGSAPEFDRRRV